MAWLEGDMTTTGSMTARTGSGRWTAHEGPEAITSAEDIRAQGGLLVLDHNRNYNLKATCSNNAAKSCERDEDCDPGKTCEANGYEGGVNPASGIDACCRFVQTTCPTPLPSPAPTSCRCVAYYGVNRNVGNFAFRDDGLVYGSLPAVNPASEHYDLAWAAGATLKDGFN